MAFKTVPAVVCASNSADRILLTKVSQIRTEVDKCRGVVSRDNQSALVVRPKYNVVASVSGRVQSVKPNRSALPSSVRVAPYGWDDLCPCHNAGLTLHDRKTCDMSRVYGGRCTMTPEQRVQSKYALFTDRYGSTDFPTLQKVTAEDKHKTVTVESTWLSNLIRGTVLVTSKIVSAVKRVIKAIKGGK